MKLTTDKKFLLDKLIEQRNNASNTFEKRIWNRQINNIKKGLCPYGCKPEKEIFKGIEKYIDTLIWLFGNKITEIKEKDRFTEVANHERLIVGNKKLDKKYS